MKVAMLGWEFPPFMAGGLGVHCLELTLGLARQGVAIDFFMPRMPGGPDVAAQHGHLRVVPVEAEDGLGPYGPPEEPYPADFNRAVAHYNERLMEAFDSTDADVLHCHDWITVPAGLELRRRTGLPLVFTVHSTEHDRSAGFYPQAWIQDIEHRGVHGADRVIAVSRYTKGLLQQHYGADPARVAAIHNGIDPARFRAAAQRDYDADRGTVLFLSRLSRQKGPLYFLEVARRVLELRPHARFVIAGQGEMLRACIDFTLQHGIAERVRFAGYVPPDELAEFYMSNELYVLPSVSEPFGISVLEAMATGLPTIVTRTSGVGEALSHVLKADFWDIDEMTDMIVRLLDSPELREEMGRNGGREVHKFSWDASARQTLDVYGSVLSGRHEVIK